MTFERKILRNIYGPRVNIFTSDKYIYERTRNDELQKLYTKPDFLAFIRKKLIK